MTEGKQGVKDRRKFIDPPYKDLYIYYLDGRLKSNHKIFHDHFIGNWQEDKFSFLFQTISEGSGKNTAFKPRIGPS